MTCRLMIAQAMNKHDTVGIDLVVINPYFVVYSPLEYYFVMIAAALVRRCSLYMFFFLLREYFSPLSVRQPITKTILGYECK